MTRRSWIAAMAAIAFDPERALWAPGKKLISIPKPRPWRIIKVSRPMRFDADAYKLQDFHNRAISMAIEAKLASPGRVGWTIGIQTPRRWSTLKPNF